MGKIKKNTLGMFNCIKGLIVLTVIFVHSSQDMATMNPTLPQPIFIRLMMNVIGITMSIMFVVSGYGFKPLKPLKALKKQAVFLLRPYGLILAAVVITKVIVNLAVGNGIFYDIIGNIVGFMFGIMAFTSFHGIEIASVAAAWFLLTLFISWMLLTLIFCIKNERIQQLLVGLCVLAGVGITFFYRIVPYCIPQSLACVGFLYLGYRIKKGNLLFRKIPVWVYALCSFVFAFGFVFGDVNIGTNSWKLGYVDYLAMLCGSFVILRLYLFLYRTDWRIYRPINYIGENSLLIICIHCYEALVILWRRQEIICTDSWWIVQIAMFVFRAPLAVILCELIHRLKMLKAKRGKERV